MANIQHRMYHACCHMEYRELDFTLIDFLIQFRRMVYAHYPNITREHHILLLGGSLTRAHNLDESWNTLKSHDDVLNYLDADIICFQGE